MSVDVVVLAAGKGTRMKSDLPKVLHTLAGKPLINHVLETAEGVSDGAIVVVVGHGSEAVKQAVTVNTATWVIQEQQLGTGHAVLQAVDQLSDSAQVIVLYGDVPLIRSATLNQLLALVTESSLAVLTVELADPTGYGRIIRDQHGSVQEIVEEKDATPEQRLVSEINTGVMAFPPQFLHYYLPQLENNNAQGEYYLTDLVAIARSNGFSIEALRADNPYETEGVNSRRQLHDLERHYQAKLAHTLQDQGVSIADVSRFDCRGELRCGSDCLIDINVVFEGKVEMGCGVTIGPNSIIANAVIGDGVSIKANTVIEGPVTIGSNVDVGPFARLRPGTVLADNSKIGNFVETKKSQIGVGSKVNHLSYIGDTTIGENANVGAGTITCNYDGVNKYKTQIGNGAFIGSNSSLVAPVSIGDRATVGAGSAISADVKDDQLAVARGRQRNIDNWQRPVKKEK